jgi:hypothetical protein
VVAEAVEDGVTPAALRRRIALGRCRQHSAPQARIDRPVDKLRASHPLPLPRFTPQRCAQGDRVLITAKRAAIDAFAAINGWRKAPAFFDLDRLGRGMPTRTTWPIRC